MLTNLNIARLVVLLLPLSAVAMGSDVSWINLAGGSWSSGTNWSTGAPPAATDTAVLPALGGAYTVTMNGSQSVAAMRIETLDATLWIQGSSAIGSAVLNVAASISNSGVIRLESSSNNSGHTSNLTIGAGLTNGASGSILIRRGGGVPTTSTITGSIANTGILDVGVSMQLIIESPSGTFTQSSGSITVDPAGKLRYRQGLFDFVGGTITGPAYCSAGSRLNIASSASSTSTIRTEESVTLVNNLSPSATVWVNATSAIGSATLTVSDPNIVNAGVIQLESSSNNSGHVSNLAITGALTNTGSISAQRGVGVPTGSSITGSLVNAGLVSATDSRLVFIGVYEGAGGTTNGSVFVRTSEIRTSAPASSATTLQLEGANTLTTNVMPGYELWAQANALIGSASLSVADEISNHGVIRLESTSNNAGHVSSLATLGEFTNAADGQVLVRRGGGVTTTANLSGNITNTGLIDVGPSMTVVHDGSSDVFQMLGGSLATETSSKYRFLSGQFIFSGGEIAGPTYCSQNSTLQIDDTVSSDSTIRTEQNVTLVRNAAQSVRVWVCGNASLGMAILTSAPGAINAGTIWLESISNNSAHTSNLDLGEALINSGLIFAQRGGGTPVDSVITGHLINQGEIAATDSRLTCLGLFKAAGGVNNGAVFVRNSELRVTGPTTGATTLQLEGATNLTTDVMPGYELWVQSNALIGNAGLSVADGISNHGIIRLESTSNNSSHASSLATTGAFTNASDGQILVRRGNGTPTTANLSGSMTNLGLMDIGPNMTTTHQGTGDVFDQTAGSLNTDESSKYRFVDGAFVFNGGTVLGPTYCSQGSTLQINSSATTASTIRTEQGVTLTGNTSTTVRVWICGNAAVGPATLTTAPGATNAGTIWLESISNNSGHMSNLAINGTFTNSGLIFAQRGGTPTDSTISGWLVNQGEVAATTARLTCVGTFEGAGGINTGSVFVRNSEVRLSAPATNDTTIQIEGAANLLTTSIQPGYELWIQGNSLLGSATITTTDGIANHGAIRLESTSNNSGHSSNLTLAGTFTNAADGRIVARRGGTPVVAAINGTLTNLGTMDVGANITLTHTGDLTNFDAGTITGGTFMLVGTYRGPHAAISTNRANVILDGASAAWNTSTNSNALAALATNDDAGVLTITNGKQFVTTAELHNRGRLVVGPGAAVSPGGGFVMDDVIGATLVAQMGGIGASNYGRLSVTGVATLRKTLRLELVNSFAPSNGDLFDILTCSTRNGEFTTVERPTFSPDLQLDVLYYPTRVRIATVRPACSGHLPGDANCDGEVNNFDIDPFVLALSDSVLYDLVYPDCDTICNCDANGDDAVNNFDINAFVRLLSGG